MVDNGKFVSVDFSWLFLFATKKAIILTVWLDQCCKAVLRKRLYNLFDAQAMPNSGRDALVLHLQSN